MTHPTIYATRQDIKNAHVSLGQFPNAGPNCNITGMKNKYWGKDALCVKHGRYVYHVDSETYNAILKAQRGE